MPRVNIDDIFWRDPRVTTLGSAIGWNGFEVRGRLLYVFALSYDRREAGDDGTLTEDEIDTIAEHPGLAAAMLRCGLAAIAGRGLYVKGSHRSDYITKKREAGREGGRRSGETRRTKQVEAPAKQCFAEREAPGNPLPLLPPPDLPPSLEPDKPLDQIARVRAREPDSVFGLAEAEQMPGKGMPMQPSFDDEMAHMADVDGMTYGEFIRRRDNATPLPRSGAMSVEEALAANAEAKRRLGVLK